jgi:hypothetical protein
MLGFFGPLQAAWQDRCNEVLANTGQEICQGDFIREYMAVRDLKFTAQTISKA